MAVQLDVEVEGSATSDGEYKVTWTVTANTDMPAEVFLHTYSTKRFDGVINASHLVYPSSRDPEFGFYRQSTAEKIYPDIETAENAQANIDTALTDLVTQYKNGLATFLSTTTNAYS